MDFSKIEVDIIYKSQTASVTHFKSPIDRDEKSCVFLFSALGGRTLATRAGGSDPLLREGVDVYCVQSTLDNWHQEVPVEIYRDLNDGLNKRYSRVLGYGSSMGGVAVLAASQFIRFDRVLVLSPQYSIREGYDPRWLRYTSEIKWLYEIKDEKAGSIDELFISYDPFDIDNIHFEKINQSFSESTVIPIPIKFGSHPVTYWLNDSGYLKDFLINILVLGQRPIIPKHLNRKNRTYYITLSRFLKSKGKIKSALKIALLATELPKVLPDDYRYISILYSELGNKLKSIEFGRLAVSKSVSKSQRENNRGHLKQLYNRFGIERNVTNLE